MTTLPSATGAEETFTAFMREVQPRVAIALTASFGPDAAADATADAFAYAWEHWDRVSVMENPAGYEYRVGRSRIPRSRAMPLVPAPPSNPTPMIEPKLLPALRRLSARQREIIVLTEGYGHTAQEVADLLGVHPSSGRRHRDRALHKLRARLGVSDA
jgi:DNA-directed RNA polymerase specialized sigma24 family protein